MYEGHELIQTPPDDVCIWRYMDFKKLASLLQREALFLARAAFLGDPFEGAVSPWTLKRREKTTEQLREQIPKEEFEKLRAAFLAQRSETANLAWYGTLINSWVMCPYESAAMWHIFGSPLDGVAVRSTVGRLKYSITDLRTVFIGPVSYVDYSRAPIDEANVLGPFLFKRRSFEHEREVRVLLVDWSFLTNMGEGNPLSEAVSEHGVYVTVDLGALIDEVFVAPTAPDWFLDLIRDYRTRLGFTFPVSRSDLDATPLR